MFAIDAETSTSISTQRFCLRFPNRSDLGPLHDAITETLPDLVKWLPWARPSHTRHETRRYLRSSRLARQNRQAFEFVIEDRQSRDVLGMCSLHRLDWMRACAGVGYWVRSSHWRQRVATEAVQGLIGHAFHELALNRLELHIALDNQVSHRVAHTLGFKPEGVAREAEFIGGVFVDHQQYSLVRSDIVRVRDRS